MAVLIPIVPTDPTDFPDRPETFRIRLNSFWVASRLWTTGQTIYPKGFVWLTASQSYYQHPYHNIRCRFSCSLFHMKTKSSACGLSDLTIAASNELRLPPRETSQDVFRPSLTGRAVRLNRSDDRSLAEQSPPARRAVRLFTHA